MHVYVASTANCAPSRFSPDFLVSLSQMSGFQPFEEQNSPSLVMLTGGMVPGSVEPSDGEWSTATVRLDDAGFVKDLNVGYLTADIVYRFSVSKDWEPYFVVLQSLAH